MSSDIPFARVVLRKALKSDDVKFVHQAIKRALGMLDREPPEFKTERKLGTNIGRVSEAINGKRKGI